MSAGGPHGPTVLLTVPTGHHVANLLRTPVLASMVDSGLRVVVVSPFAGDSRFREEFHGPALTHEALEPFPVTKLTYAVDSILGELFLRQSGLVAVRLQLDRARRLDPWAGRGALAGVKRALSRLPVTRAAWFGVERALVAAPWCRALFDRHRPAVVATSTAGFFAAEIPVLAEAVRRGVPTLGIDLGWDNLSSKFHTVRPVGGMAVWNEAMRDEAVRHHGLAPDAVHVTGSPQLDRYFTGQSAGSRDAFCAAIGASPDARIVTLATAPAAVYEDTPVVVETLFDAVAAGVFGDKAHLLVRVHPRDKIERYVRWANAACVRVEKPMARVEGARAADAFDAVSPTADQRGHLAATLAHSDVIVNFASTTALEACLFDTPVVNIGFDRQPDLPLSLSIRRYFSFEHYRPMADLGAVRVAGSARQLVDEVRAYLAEPGRDAGARRNAVARLYPCRDGRSAERVASLVQQTAMDTAGGSR